MTATSPFCRSTAGSQEADDIDHPEGDQRERDIREPLLPPWAEWSRRWEAGPGDARRGPAEPPTASSQPQPLPARLIKPALPHPENERTDGGARHAVPRVRRQAPASARYTATSRLNKTWSRPSSCVTPLKIEIAPGPCGP